MVKRNVVGAHYGLKDWIAQRITAVLMVLYILIFAICAFSLPDTSYTAWRGLFAGGVMRVATLVFFLALFYHAWIGVRDLFMDYVGSAGIRLTLHCAVIVILLGYTAWVAQALWRL